MPVNKQDLPKIPAYNPPKEDKELLDRLRLRTDYLKRHRAELLANHYDTAKTARSIEETWDFCDYVSLPHKFSGREMKDWMAKNSRPMIYSKIDTALSVIVAKNPEVEIAARKDASEYKSKILTALYNLSWDKGNGRQQFIKFAHSCAKYGFAVGREYHRYEEATVPEYGAYDPNTQEQILGVKTITRHDEPHFETLPIRDCWFDDRARPYDEGSVRDWFWEVTYDYSTFLKKFPVSKYPDAVYVQPSYSSTPRQSRKDKADVADDQNPRPQVRLKFYESLEDNEFIISDMYSNVLIYKAPLLGNELSCVWAMWRIRNDWCIYGVGVAEILENDQELYDRVSNMTINQMMLAIGGSGFYGGTGNLTEKDMVLEPKLKKLRDADKIVFPKIPPPDATVFKALEDIKAEADEYSGITMTLEGDQMGKTLGEAVLNREAGLRRLALPLANLEFALERHARLRVENIQRIYMKPRSSTIVQDGLGNISDQKLYTEYQAELAKSGADNPAFIQRFPSDPATGMVFANKYREERLPFEKGQQGEIQPSQSDNWMEVTPADIEGEYDVRIRAMSTIPPSRALDESRALETFNLIAKLPYTDIYKSQKRMLNKRGEDPADWMMDDQLIMAQQQAAQMAPMMGGPQPEQPEQGASTLVPQGQLENPASSQGLAGQISNMQL
jgi:hypothetical protein